MDTESIKELLKKHGLHPEKQFGQNFLTDQHALNNIITAANLKSTDTVLEIGPGLGVLTKELAKKAKRVIAIEKDRNMVAILQEALKGFSNIELIQDDALHGNYELPTDYSVIANIPYYITSPLIRKFLEAKNQPEKIILMVQKEVAQRICAKPPKMNLLAVSVQYYAGPKILFNVSKNSFWPAPKVDSAIIEIIPQKEKSPEDAEAFFKVVKAGFSQPRKKLINNLTQSLNIEKEQAKTWLTANSIDPDTRAERLNIEAWRSLTKTLPQVYNGGV